MKLAGRRVFVAGHRGLVGSALVRRLPAWGVRDIVVRTRAELDLTDTLAVRRFFETESIDVVFLAAARVGGIGANRDEPADFLRENLIIQTNVIEAAHRSAVPKLVFFGSSCIYPRDAPQPIPESALLTGPLEATNEAYAIAKIAGILMVQAYRRQYGHKWIALMPTNLYGPCDNFDLARAHVVPALLRRFHDAKATGGECVTVWGTGTPRRELMHVDDLAEASCMLAENYDAEAIINVGTGEDITIRDLVFLVRQTVGYHGDVTFDPTKPDGTPRKLLDMRRLSSMGFRPRIPLSEGLTHTYAWLCRALEDAGGSHVR